MTTWEDSNNFFPREFKALWSARHSSEFRRSGFAEFGDREMLFRLVFLHDCLLGVDFRFRERLAEGNETILKVVGSNFSNVDHLRVPGRQAQGMARQCDAGSTDHRRFEPEKRLAV